MTKIVPMPNGGVAFYDDLPTRFKAKVDKRALCDCWPWLAYLTPDGYGMIRDGNNMRPATHVALELSGRPRPPAPNNHALHSDKCVTRACCNPDHLRWGSNAENVADRERLGRNKIPYVCGERQGSAKLTAQKVRQIRNAQGSQRTIAKQFGVSQMTVSLVKQRKTWAHVE